MTEAGARKPSDLGARLLVAVIGVPILLAIAFYAPNWGVWLFFSLAALIGVHEYYTMTLKRVAGAAWVGLLATAATLSALYWGDASHVYAAAAGGVLLTLMATMRESIETEQLAARVGHLAMGALYGTLLFGGLILLTAAPERPGEVAADQAGWFLFPMFVIWFGDTGAYFAGRAFGRHKLAPRLSPKKTWEGAVGGALASVAGGFVARAIFFDDMLVWQVILLALPGAVLGQIGDLAESLIKRSTGVKDSGTILGGHGGMLDRVDALVFAAPYFATVKAFLSL